MNFIVLILSGVSNILSALINMNVEEQNIMNSSHYTAVKFNLPVTETIPASLMSMSFDVISGFCGVEARLLYFYPR